MCAPKEIAQCVFFCLETRHLEKSYYKTKQCYRWKHYVFLFLQRQMEFTDIALHLGIHIVHFCSQFKRVPACLNIRNYSTFHSF